VSLLEITADLKETAKHLDRIASALECLLAIQIHGDPAIKHLKGTWEPGQPFRFPQPLVQTIGKKERPVRLTQPTDEELWNIEQQAERTRQAGLPPETTEPE
jgi:hypothetical protein